MTEAEAIETLSILGANGATYFTLFTTFTFAYLTVAYFVGASLTRFQCIAVSAIYFFTASMMGASTMVYVDTFAALKARELTIMNESWIGNLVTWPTVVTIMLASMMLISLYFMYDVRRRANYSHDT